MHSVAPSAAENDPAEHATQALDAEALALAEYLPLSQLVHVAEELRPSTSDHVPAVQFVHCVWLVYPVPTPYDPLAQGVQSLAPSASE